MISVIFVGRNDNYGGDFEKRLFATLTHNAGRLEQLGIEYEIVFVEWNPLPYRRSLSRKIAKRFERAACYIVHNDLHRHISTNRYIAVYEYHAKNVGAKRARGEWLLLTNPDDYWGDDVFEFLKAGEFDPKTAYRAGWINIQTDSDVNNPALEDEGKEDTPPYCNHSGDFVFCHRTLFDSVGGYREDLAFTNTHKDSILCLAMYDQTQLARKIGTMYHVKHKKTGRRRRRIKFDPTKVPRIPQPDYGHADIACEKQVCRRVRVLHLKPELRTRSRFALLPKPTVPPEYRLAAQPGAAC